MKKFFVLLAVVCGLSLGCQPSTPPADSGTTTPPTTSGTEVDETEEEVDVVEETEEDLPE